MYACSFDRNSKVCVAIIKAYIVGSKNLRASSFKDHAFSEMHSLAMLLLEKQQFTATCRLLHVMDSTLQQTVEQKFDIAFLIAKENMALTKMKAIRM